MKFRSILTMAVLSLGSLAASAYAQQNAAPQRVQLVYANYDGHEQREYNHGYKDGTHAGVDDARHGRRFNLDGHGSYRDHRDHEYREGFERGYREGYRANLRHNDHDRDRDREHNHF